MKRLLILTLLLATNFSYAQKRQVPQGQLLNEAPAWAQLMYADSPNVYEVDQAYLEHYRNISFEFFNLFLILDYFFSQLFF